MCIYSRKELDYTFVENDTRERTATGNFNANSTEEKEWGAVAKDEAGTALLMRKV